jgi:riboflavin biosynthesis pyrimidine reductase
MRYLDTEHCPPLENMVAEHTALPDDRVSDRAFIRLNMIASADGGSAVAGLSGGLGNRDDHDVYKALRDGADGVLVGLGTVVAEHYRPPAQADLRLYVVADTPDVSGNAELFESGTVTLVLPEDAGPAPAGVPEIRGGHAGQVDLPKLAHELAGKVLIAEGGPTLAGVLASLELIDEFFLTVSPRVIAGGSGRVVHGPDADPDVWRLHHGFVDDDGYLFLRYVRQPA